MLKFARKSANFEGCGCEGFSFLILYKTQPIASNTSIMVAHGDVKETRMHARAHAQTHLDTFLTSLRMQTRTHLLTHHTHWYLSVSHLHSPPALPLSLAPSPPPSLHLTHSLTHLPLPPSAILPHPPTPNPPSPARHSNEKEALHPRAVIGVLAAELPMHLIVHVVLVYRVFVGGKGGDVTGGKEGE